MGHLAQVVDVREVLDSIFSTAFKKRRKEKKELLACNFPDRSAKVSVFSYIDFWAEKHGT
jgi:hypothetical protein